MLGKVLKTKKMFETRICVKPQKALHHRKTKIDDQQVDFDHCEMGDMRQKVRLTEINSVVKSIEHKKVLSKSNGG